MVTVYLDTSKCSVGKYVWNTYCCGLEKLQKIHVAVNFLTHIKLWRLPKQHWKYRLWWLCHRSQFQLSSYVRSSEELRRTGGSGLDMFWRWHEQKCMMLLLLEKVYASWAESWPWVPAHNLTAARQTWKTPVLLLIYINSNFPKVSSIQPQRWTIFFAASFLHGCLDTQSNFSCSTTSNKISPRLLLSGLSHIDIYEAYKFLQKASFLVWENTFLNQALGCCLAHFT